MCSQKDNLDTPDLSDLSPLLHYAPEDRFLSSGTTASELSSGIYPDPKNILKNISGPIEDLKVGGFHQGDCVDRFAACAYYEGIPTLVDEDTTDHYFIFRRKRKGIPDFREFTLVGFGLIGKRDKPSSPRYELMTIIRKTKPWLVNS
jgi:hypothetical protein